MSTNLYLSMHYITVTGTVYLELRSAV